jgi:hypothetical protein
MPINPDFDRYRLTPQNAVEQAMFAPRQVTNQNVPRGTQSFFPAANVAPPVTGLPYTPNVQSNIGSNPFQGSNFGVSPFKFGNDSLTSFINPQQNVASDYSAGGRFSSQRAGSDPTLASRQPYIGGARTPTINDKPIGSALNQDLYDPWSRLNRINVRPIGRRDIDLYGYAGAGNY